MIVIGDLIAQRTRARNSSSSHAGPYAPRRALLLDDVGDARGRRPLARRGGLSKPRRLGGGRGSRRRGTAKKAAATPATPPWRAAPASARAVAAFRRPPAASGDRSRAPPRARRPHTGRGASGVLGMASTSGSGVASRRRRRCRRRRGSGVDSGTGSGGGGGRSGATWRKRRSSASSRGEDAAGDDASGACAPSE